MIARTRQLTGENAIRSKAETGPNLKSLAAGPEPLGPLDHLAHRLSGPSRPFLAPLAR